MHWASCVESEDQIESEFPDSYIHEWRLPYPKNNAIEHKVEDISFIHFARVNVKRQINKNIFYKVITRHKEPNKSMISINRMYRLEKDEKKYPVSNDIYSFYELNKLIIINEISFEDSGKYYLHEVKKYFEKDGILFYVGLSIWNKHFLEYLNIKDHRNILYKTLHFYLSITQSKSDTLPIKIIDKVLKFTNL